MHDNQEKADTLSRVISSLSDEVVRSSEAFWSSGGVRQLLVSDDEITAAVVGSDQAARVVIHTGRRVSSSPTPWCSCSPVKQWCGHSVAVLRCWVEYDGTDEDLSPVDPADEHMEHTPQASNWDDWVWADEDQIDETAADTAPVEDPLDGANPSASFEAEEPSEAEDPDEQQGQHADDAADGRSDLQLTSHQWISDAFLAVHHDDWKLLYRTLAKCLHPDRNGDVDAIVALNRVWEMLEGR